jgi:RNA polymerase sigma-70 factor (ECF subfamily)
MVDTHAIRDLADHQLLAATRSGRDEAFAVLVGRYRESLSRYLYFQTGDPHLVEDLVQDTYFDLFRSLNSVPEDLPFNAWLFKTARHNLQQHWRRARVRRMLSLEWLWQRRLAQTPHWEDEASTSIQRELVEYVLQQINPTLREALLMHSVWGFSCPEIAAMLGISLNAAEKRVGRAKRQFADIWTTHTEAEPRRG